MFQKPGYFYQNHFLQALLMRTKVNGGSITYKAAQDLHPLPWQDQRLSLDYHSHFLIFQTISFRYRYVLLPDVRAGVLLLPLA